MAHVSMPKDLKKIKTKVVFNLTMRQLIGMTLAGIVSIPAYLFVKNYFPTDVSAIILVIIALPFIFVAFFEKNGLYLEQYIKYIYLQKFYQPQKRFRKEVLQNEKQNGNSKIKIREKSKKFKN